MSIKAHIPYDYMPKGSYLVTGGEVIFFGDVPEKLKKRFLEDYKKNEEYELEMQIQRALRD